MIAEAPNLSEKMTLIDILSIKQSVTPQAVRWVPTWAMLADGLTKRDKKLRLKLSQWLQNPTVALTDSQHTSTGATTLHKGQIFSTLGDGPPSQHFCFKRTFV